MRNKDKIDTFLMWSCIGSFIVSLLALETAGIIALITDAENITTGGGVAIVGGIFLLVAFNALVAAAINDEI